VEMRAFVEGELRPHAAEWEAARLFPDEVFSKLAARGWLGLKYGLLADLDHPDAHDLARAARDARLGPIGGGTDEIMKEILAKTLGL
jgi:alkylation response protein AidB-like acyl-CoA dehydrogenase